MAKKRAAIHPGEIVAQELEARQWTQADLARIVGRPFQHINLLVNARRRLTVETAVELAGAFGTSTDVWLNLQARYDSATAPKPDPTIVKRARAMAS